MEFRFLFILTNTRHILTYETAVLEVIRFVPVILAFCPSHMLQAPHIKETKLLSLAACIFEQENEQK